MKNKRAYKKSQKRSYILIALILILTGAKGETWTLHPAFTGVDNMAETKGRVYFNAGGSLYAYDKTNDETIAYSELNDLNDSDVRGVWAALGATRVAVAYSNGNIDIIQDNGKVLNFPDIRDSRMSNKKINDITFSDDSREMVVATDFGLVRFNVAKGEVKDSWITNSPVSSVTIGQSKILAATEEGLSGIDIGATLQDAGSRVSYGNYNLSNLIDAGEVLFGVLETDGQKRAVVFTELKPDGQSPYMTLSNKPVLKVARGDSSNPVFYTDENTLYSVDVTGRISNRYNIPSYLPYYPFTAWGGAGDLWFGRVQGVCNVDLTGTSAHISEPIATGAMSVKDVHFQRYGDSGKLYIGNRGNSNVYVNRNTGIKAQQAILSPNGEFKDVTPREIRGRDGRTSHMTDPLFMREDPDNKEIYYTGNLHDGFYALSSEDGSMTVHYNEDNSLLTDYYGIRVMDIAFDPRGYMWVLSEREPEKASIMVLSPEGRAKGNGVTKEDWREVAASEPFSSGRDGQIEVSGDGRYVYAMGNNDLFVIDTHETATTDDDEGHHVVNFLMQDGSGYVSFDRFGRMMEDQDDGRLWITTSAGVFYIPEPWNVTNGTVTIVKPKVARGDGSGLADYLLSTQYVYGLAADSQNGKWFVTRDSGVFLTNADGTEIIANYNTGNSPLPSNRVLSVSCSGNGDGTVYLGTHLGLLELHSEYSTGQEGYGDVNIYPNPVRPNYLGDITIEGLPRGAKVKIVSTGGTVMAELESEGGAAHWSGRGQGGQRVPTGVYHVLASSEQDAGRQVGKIVVVR